METIQAMRRHRSSRSSSERDYSGEKFNGGERSDSDSSAKNCQLTGRQRSISSPRYRRKYCSPKARKWVSSTDKSRHSSPSRGRRSRSLSSNINKLSRRSVEDSSPEMHKREWLPSSSRNEYKMSLARTNASYTRYDSLSSDFDNLEKKDVKKQHKKESFFQRGKPPYISENSGRVSTREKTERSSSFKDYREFTSRKETNSSSSMSESTSTKQHTRKVNTSQRSSSSRYISSSQEIRPSTSHRSDNLSVLSRGQIPIESKYRRAEARSSTSTSSSRSREKKHYSPSTDRKRYSRSTEKKRCSPLTEKKRYSPLTEKKRYSPLTEKKCYSPSMGKKCYSPSTEKNRYWRSTEKKPSSRSTKQKYSSGSRTKENSSSSTEISRSLSQSDSRSPVSDNQPSHETRFSQSKPRTQSPSLSGTDSCSSFENCDKNRRKDTRHWRSDLVSKRSVVTKDRTLKSQGNVSVLKPKNNKRDTDYVQIQVALKRKRSPCSSSSDNATSECHDFGDLEHSRKRRRLNESDSCNQTRISMKTKVHSTVVVSKTSPQGTHKDVHPVEDCPLQADGHSSYQKQRSRRDNILLHNCCSNSDGTGSNFKGRPSGDDSKLSSASYARKGWSGSTSGRPCDSSHFVTHQRPSDHHFEGSPSFSSPSFISNQSPRSTLRNLDQPHQWTRDLMARSRTYSGTFIDSHCHIDLIYDRLGLSHGTRFSEFRRTVAHSFPVNFEGCVAVFCYPKTYDPINPQNQLFKTLAHDDGVWFAIGCHPKSATEFTSRHELGLRKALRKSKVVALGEIGLDYSGTFYRHAETQKTVLRKQLQMAVEMKLPLVLHCRDAYEDCLTILMEMVPRSWPIHLHCFCGNADTASVWLQTFPNLYIGLTPVITYRNAHDAISTARNIPLSRLLLETDSPYFVPGNIPKGKSSVSHPGLALFTAERIAELKNVSVDTVLQACRMNTYSMYGV